MNAGEQLLNALGDGAQDPLAMVKQQAMMKVLLRPLTYAEATAPP